MIKQNVYHPSGVGLETKPPQYGLAWVRTDGRERAISGKRL
jgi:hypothetical protein